MDRSAWKERTEIFVPWLQVLGLVLGGLYAVDQYNEHVKEVKVQRTVDYLARLKSGELLDASTKLSTQLQTQFEVFQATHPDSPTEQENMAAYYKFVMCDVLKHGQKESLEPRYERDHWILG